MRTTATTEAVNHDRRRFLSATAMGIALDGATSLPSDADIAPGWDAFIATMQRPASQARLRKLMERGFHKPGDAENRLGYYVGQLGA